MNNLISKIISGNNLEEAYSFSIQKLFSEGPTSVTVLEILSYLAKYQDDFFSSKEHEVLNLMGLFYKDTQALTLKEAIFKHFGEAIREKYNCSYTLVQSDIAESIKTYHNFSFSAPTSTGKSFVFNNLITNSQKDIIIIVPSRALINEYFTKLYQAIPDKQVNILTSVSVINTKHASRNIFVLTPERTKEIFQYKQDFNIEYFLFDEAQLSDEASFRGLFFDSIVRRVQRHFSNAKCVFAHPFVENPDAQLIKNNFSITNSSSFTYTERNIGQMFFTHKDDKFYHFGINKAIMGNNKFETNEDPIYDCIRNNGSVLIYTPKTSIYKRSVFADFKKYIDLCEEITDEASLALIDQLRELIGASTSSKEFYYSKMIEMLKKGIVIHHGSLPLQVRLLLEEFTQKNYCKICFATSTLEQGINMPFDIVYLNQFKNSKPLSVKNLIGRAGRSSTNSKFDFGTVIVKGNVFTKLRNIMSSTERLKIVSQLDEKEPDDDNFEFKESIRNNDFSDEYNLPNKEVARLSSTNLDEVIKKILSYVFKQSRSGAIDIVVQNLTILYKHYLNRELSEGEENVLKEAFHLFLLRLQGKTFQAICRYRYQHTVKAKTQEEYRKNNESSRIEFLQASFIQECCDIPKKTLCKFSLFEVGTKVYDVDYDRIVCDTYDYFDKLINFRLSDVFYAIFKQYSERNKDLTAMKLAMHFKYGTDNERNILLLKYGLSNEEIEEFSDYIESVTTEELTVKPEILEKIPDAKLTYIKRFIHNV